MAVFKAWLPMIFFDSKGVIERRSFDGERVQKKMRLFLVSVFFDE